MIGSAVLRIGTRRSRLARAQAELVVRALADAGLTQPSELAEISTAGDAISEAHPGGGFEATDGQFTGELEAAVRDARVDLAVHSFKDLPTRRAPGTRLAAVLPRADARDCLLSPDGIGLKALPVGARVGTGSARRAAQLQAVRPDLSPAPIRGNVETRIARMRSGEYEAVVLACAGLDRLGLELPDSSRLPFEVVLPAPAQGAIAVEVREDRDDLAELLAAVDHAPTRLAVEVERELLVRIGGGCLAPLGTLGEVDGGELRLRAVYAAAPGELRRAEERGPVADRDRIVAEVAGRLLAVREGRR